MIELGVAMLVGAVAMTLVSDTIADTTKLIRATQRRPKIRVADHH